MFRHQFCRIIENKRQQNSTLASLQIAPKCKHIFPLHDLVTNTGEFFELGRMLPLPGAITSQLDKVWTIIIVSCHNLSLYYLIVTITTFILDEIFIDNYLIFENSILNIVETFIVNIIKITSTDQHY